MGFEKDIDAIFCEINAYIPQFTSRSDTLTTSEKHWIFGAAFTVVSGLVINYRFYKSYTFKKKCQKNITLYSKWPKAFQSGHSFHQKKFVISS